MCLSQGAAVFDAWRQERLGPPPPPDDERDDADGADADDDDACARSRCFVKESGLASLGRRWLRCDEKSACVVDSRR